MGMRSVDRESDHKTILRIVLSDECSERKRRAGAVFRNKPFLLLPFGRSCRRSRLMRV